MGILQMLRTMVSPTRKRSEEEDDGVPAINAFRPPRRTMEYRVDDDPFVKWHMEDGLRQSLLKGAGVPPPVENQPAPSSGSTPLFNNASNAITNPLGDDIIPEGLKTGAYTPPAPRQQETEDEFVGAASRAFANLAKAFVKKEDTAGGETEGGDTATGTDTTTDSTTTENPPVQQPTNPNDPASNPNEVDPAVPAVKPADSATPSATDASTSTALPNAQNSVSTFAPVTSTSGQVDNAAATNSASGGSAQNSEWTINTAPRIELGSFNTGKAYATYGPDKKWYMYSIDEDGPNGPTAYDKFDSFEALKEFYNNAENDASNTIVPATGGRFQGASHLDRTSQRTFQGDEAAAFRALGMMPDGTPITREAIAKAGFVPGKDKVKIGPDEYEIYRHTDGRFELFDSKGARVDPNTMPQDALKRATQLRATADTAYKGFAGAAGTDIARQGTINPADIQPVDNDGTPTLVDGYVIQDGDNFVVVAKNLNGVNGLTMRRSLSEEEAREIYQRTGYHMGIFKTQAGAQGALSQIQAKAQAGDFDYRQADQLNELSEDIKRPYTKGEQTFEFEGGKVFVRGDTFYNVPKKGKAPTVNVEAGNSSELRNEVALRARLAQMPQRNAAEIHAYNRVAATLASAQLKRLRTEKITDKTHNFWDVLRAGAWGALKGFATGGIGGALGGFATGAIAGTFDKTADTKLKRDVWDIPRATGEVANAQQALKASGEEVELDLKVGKARQEATKADVEIAQARENLIKDITENDGWYKTIVKDGKHAQAADIKAYEERVTQRLRNAGYLGKNEKWSSGLKEGSWGDMDVRFDDKGFLVQRPKNSNLPFVRVQQYGPDGTGEYIQRPSEAEGILEVDRGEEGVEPITIKNTEANLGKIMVDMMQANQNEIMMAERTNASARQAVENAYVAELNNRERALAGLAVDWSRAANGAATDAKGQQAYNAAMQSYQEAKGRYEAAKAKAEDPDTGSKERQAAEKAMGAAADDMATQLEKAAKAVPLDDDGNPVMRSANPEQLQEAARILKSTPKRGTPQTVPVPKRIRFIPRGTPRNPVTTPAPGTSFTPPDPSKQNTPTGQKIEGSTSYLRSRKTRNSNSTSA